MTCPYCQAQNDDAAEMCFTCGRGLSGLTHGAVVAGRYEILKPLGRGGMGTVYKAHDRELDEVVALKLLRGEVAQAPDMARRFRSEIKLARRVRHPNVCAIHEYGQDGALRFIAMEFVEGTDLKRLLRERGALPIEEALDIAIQSAEGLAAVHGQGIVHRDLKTPNIMVDGAGLVRLMDFGIAKQLVGGESHATATGHVIGTPEYMSPEQARGLKVDLRSDIYALGIVIYEIFTGDVPFRGDTPLATLFKHIQDPPPLEGGRAARIPAAVVPVLARALAKEPDDRYATVAEMATDLRRARGAWTAAPTPVRARSRAATAPQTQIIADPAQQTEPYPTPVPTSVPTGVRTASLPPPTELVSPRAGRPAAEGRGPRPPRPVVADGSAGPRRALWIGAPALAAVAVLGWWWASGPDEVAVPTAPPAASPGSLGSIEPEGVLPPAATTAPTVTTAPSFEGRPASAPTAIPSPFSVRPSPMMARVPTPQPPRATPLPAPPQREPAARIETPAPRPPDPEPVRAATPPPAPVRTPPAAAEPAPPPTGLVQVRVKPWADVAVNGQPVGTTPFRPLKLPAGIHTLVFSHPQYKPFQRKVTVLAGQTVSVDVDLAWEAFKK